MGLDFYKRSVELEKKYGHNQNGRQWPADQWPAFGQRLGRISEKIRLDGWYLT